MFPGGFFIGTAMAVNLLAAHGIRFTVQARGARLVAGMAVIAIGAALTWLVVMGGTDKDVVEGSTKIPAGALWMSVKIALAALWASILYGLWAIEPSQKIERWTLVVLGIVVGGTLGALWYFGPAATPDASSMRILWQLIKATTASLVLLAGCVLLFRKRAGIVLLHAGVGLMMANELVVYSLHSEGIMRIVEGETSNYLEDIRTLELAVIEPVEKDEEEVTVIPKSFLQSNKTIHDEHLPFDIDALKFFQNSTLHQSRPDEANPATAGAGLKWVPQSERPIGGVEASKEVDMSAAYIKLLRKDSDTAIGTYLLSMELEPQTVEVDGKKYQLALRFKRNYRPYEIKLLDVRKDDYIGTNTAHNYSSDVRLVDSEYNIDRPVHIWMNNPLRYAGETFYQSGYTPSPQGEISTLQVVKNTGWMIPYVACMIVASGMLAQFCLTLTRFLRRERSTVVVRDTLGWVGIAVPAAAVVILGGWLAGKAVEPKPISEDFNYYEFGKLPIVYEGRVKPFDTLARNSLRLLSNWQTYKDSEDTRQPAVRWLLDTITRKDASFKHRVFRIDHPEVLELLELKPRKNFLYATDEISPRLQEFEQQAIAARDLDPHEMNTYQKKLLELDKKLQHDAMLIDSFTPPRIPEEDAPKELLEILKEQNQRFATIKVPLAAPPVSENGHWEPFAQGLDRSLCLQPDWP